jgi:hypothetical protein
VVRIVNNNKIATGTNNRGYDRAPVTPHLRDAFMTRWTRQGASDAIREFQFHAYTDLGYLINKKFCEALTLEMTHSI